jgi:hypothetical protein
MGNLRFQNLGQSYPMVTLAIKIPPFLMIFSSESFSNYTQKFFYRRLIMNEQTQEAIQSINEQIQEVIQGIKDEDENKNCIFILASEDEYSRKLKECVATIRLLRFFVEKSITKSGDDFNYYVKTMFEMAEDMLYDVEVINTFFKAVRI